MKEASRSSNEVKRRGEAGGNGRTRGVDRVCGVLHGLHLVELAQLGVAVEPLAFLDALPHLLVVLLDLARVFDLAEETH
jgi:hypothetical protein